MCKQPTFNMEMSVKSEPIDTGYNYEYPPLIIEQVGQDVVGVQDETQNLGHEHDPSYINKHRRSHSSRRSRNPSRRRSSSRYPHRRRSSSRNRSPSRREYSRRSRSSSTSRYSSRDSHRRQSASKSRSHKKSCKHHRRRNQTLEKNLHSDGTPSHVEYHLNDSTLTNPTISHEEPAKSIETNPQDFSSYSQNIESTETGREQDELLVPTSDARVQDGNEVPSTSNYKEKKIPYFVDERREEERLKKKNSIYNSKSKSRRSRSLDRRSGRSRSSYSSDRSHSSEHQPRSSRKNRSKEGRNRGRRSQSLDRRRRRSRSPYSSGRSHSSRHQRRSSPRNSPRRQNNSPVILLQYPMPVVHPSGAPIIVGYGNPPPWSLLRIPPSPMQSHYGIPWPQREQYPPQQRLPRLNNFNRDNQFNRFPIRFIHGALRGPPPRGSR